VRATAEFGVLRKSSNSNTCGALVVDVAARLVEVEVDVETVVVVVALVDGGVGTIVVVVTSV
jgi:hypothetical protein